MFIKSRIKDLLSWKSSIINSNVRHWDTFNLIELSSISRSLTVDMRFIIKHLDSSLSLLSTIFARGGRAWFYNVFYRRKRYDINLKTMLYRQSSRPFYKPYGVAFPDWFPGKLSNHRFTKRRTKLMKKRLFFHKFSVLRKSIRFYRPGGFRSFVQRRRRRYSIPRWARLDKYWRPRSRSRRKGISYKRLALHFKTFMKKFRRRRFKFRHYRPKKPQKLKRRRILRRKFKFFRRPRFETWIYFNGIVSSFFYKPSFGRSFNLYSKFVPVKYSKIQLDKLMPGTPDNPTDLPITNMPTTSVRRKEKKKKKIFKLRFKHFNNAQGDDFKFLIKDHKSEISSKSKLYLNFKGALYFPTARFYKLLLIRPYKALTKLLLKRYGRRRGRYSFNKKFKHRKLRFKLRRTKIKKYKLRYKNQSKIFKWLSKVLILSAKTLRLEKGVPALAFRSLYSTIAFNKFSQPFHYSVRSRYKMKLVNFYSINKRILSFKTFKPFKRFYNLEFRSFFKRTKRIRRFKLTKAKARLGSIIKGEKLFTSSSNRTFKKILNSSLNLKRKSLISFFLSKHNSFKTSLLFKFNLSLLKPLRQKRLISGKYFNLKKFYKVKKSPTDRLTLTRKLKSLPNVSNRKFINFNKSNMFKKALLKAKLFKPVQTTKLPYFLRKKALKKIIYSSKNFFKLKNKLQLDAKPHRLYPSIIFVSRLTRLTSSVLNEARVTGVISVYFSSGEATPLRTLYNILINDSLRSLAQIEPVVKNIFLISKTNVLLRRSYVLEF